MIWSLILLSIPVVTIVYYLSYFTLSVLLRVHNKHYFLGFGGSFFEFTVRDTIFTVGTFIPFFGLARFSKIENYARHRPDYPWEFSRRPWLSRALATYGGAIGVLVFAITILITENILVNEQYISRDELNRYGVYPSSLAESYGFKKGDRILTINGQQFERYQELLDPGVYQTSGNTFLVERGDKRKILRVPEGDHQLAPRQPFLEIMVPFEIESVVKNSPAEAIGLQKGDRILSVNGIRIDKINDMRREFLADDDGTVDLRIRRVIDRDTLILQHTDVKLDDGGSLGIFSREPINYTVKANSFTEAVRKGILTTLQFIRTHFDAILGHFKSESEVSKGPISISAAFGDDRYWEHFWFFTASFATFCVVWNIFPYPRSAFWEVIPLLYEGITRKKYSYNLFRTSLKLAWAMLLIFYLVTLVMDLRKLF